MLMSLKRSLHPTDFRPSHGLFELRSRGNRSGALLIGCSDLGIDPFSLIPPNTHDLYVLQNFGNLAHGFDSRQPDQMLPVSDAMSLYSIRDIVICGHSPCGLMKHVLSIGQIDNGALDDIGFRHVRTTWRIVTAELGGHVHVGDRALDTAAEVNVLVQLQNLRGIPEVAHQLDRGELHLHGWIYRGGALSAYDPRQGRFVPLAQ
jgi:carbonic anhydrase